ncbi:Fe-S cluster assembly protein dre2 [Talaromyces proteolyticus]|uniref:Fe-S cluster assembly protein dre2 n=1 Tax=Talaromyces proteolyticus TaxID=1131652 RepID=A0AAD4KF53_9EURO|nr:Fe-S cluster assembly protein dre2 [Talaromyces proteolyticus]KAH8689470.1 Fe-S cluster assembly protein dre2 [Talaromyces proteolyticus]
MPSFPVTIDTTADFGVGSAPSARSLLLAPPSIAAHEEKLRALFTSFDRSTTDLQMLDRLSAGFVSLPPATYDLVLVLTDTDGALHTEALRLLNRDVFTGLIPSMKAGAKLKLQTGALGESDAREAILAGLVFKDGAFEKPAYEGGSVPLKFGIKRKNKEKKESGAQSVAAVNQNGSVQININDDELIDEDDLLSDEDMKRPVQQPERCQPETQKKRRRPCKDCTCGLAAELEAEDQTRREQADSGLNVLKLQSADLNDEIDFTVQGKTSSCNSCSLGDAFRCSTCPFIGLPAFKPGEEVKILNDMAQL